jgi:hypothetical protein
MRSSHGLGLAGIRISLLLCASFAFSQVAGSGTTNFVPRWTSSNTLGNTELSYNPSGGRFAINSSGSVAKFSLRTGLNFAMWIQGTAPGAHAIIGESTSNTQGGTGVEGTAHGPSGIGVHGIGGHEGVVAEGSGDSAAIGLHAKGTGFGLLSEIYLGYTGGIAGVFSNPTGGDILLGTSGYSMDHKFRVDGAGNVFANAYNTGGADFAEAVSARVALRPYEPGDVLTIDDSADRKVSLSQTAYSTLIAGIYSTKPGIVAGPSLRMSDRMDSQLPLAIVGIVPCKVTAANGSISRGDLLVSSAEPGYAMKGTDRSRMLGAVLGKAMQPLESGKGTIEVLVTLQ